MITVTIDINGRKIHSVSGVNVSETLGHKYGSGKQDYRINRVNDLTIEHDFEDGAIVLAIKMLETINGLS